MRFERLARTLYATPWAITPAVYMTFHDVFQRRIEGRTISVMGEKLEYKTPDEYDVENGVAVVKIQGALGHRLDAIEKACVGAVDYLDIQQAIHKAEADPDVSSILLHISSPGGMVTGLPETASVIANASKPVVAYTDDLCASAGYYLATSADTIYATQSAEVGCIGTLMTWLDVSKAYEMQGVERELIASGKYKGMLTPGLPLSDEQRAFLQDEVDDLAEEFRGHVLNRRGYIAPDYMEGQTVRGYQAQKAGLIDDVGPFEQALFEAQTQGEDHERD